MRYLSTRGGMAPLAFSEILLGGLAPDGGLVLPEELPVLSAAELAAWRGLDYPSLADAIVARFADDLPAEARSRMVRDAYSMANFGDPAITPLQTLAPDLHLLKLSNGPTLAFKDIAMQLLGRLFEYVLADQKRSLNILGATSGDTGSAAEYAMRGRQGIRVFMLSPAGRMSPFQQAQMFSLQDPNIFNIAVEGVFDDCQDLVKAVSADAEFKQRYAIGTVNSINWARVMAQIVYYFKGYFAATSTNDQQVSFAVPSGKFGNVLAGHLARRMGLPIRRLVVATNENDVLDEFFRTGHYRTRTAAETLETSSPSMDISKASNFERFIFDVVGRDPARVKALWAQLDAEGGFDLSGTEERRRVSEFGFVSGRSTHADRIATIRSIWAEYQVVVDPHTADGLKVAQPWREPGVPMICLETALPIKFAGTIHEALGREPARPAAFEGIEALPRRVSTLGAELAPLKQFIREHCEPVARAG